LQADGFILVDARAAADFVLDCKLTAFSLDIAARDQRNISALVEIQEPTSGKQLWSGQVVAAAERYAGANGNTRASISAFLNEGIAEFVGRFSAAIHERLLRAYPQEIVEHEQYTKSSIAGVSTLSVAAPGSLPAPTANSPPASKITANTGPGVAQGRISIVSTPSRAKVYIGDVYYGLSPLQLDLPAGIVTVLIKHSGYANYVEKVALQPGKTLELEAELRK